MHRQVKISYSNRSKNTNTTLKFLTNSLHKSIKKRTHPLNDDNNNNNNNDNNNRNNIN